MSIIDGLLKNRNALYVILKKIIIFNLNKLVKILQVVRIKNKNLIDNNWCLQNNIKMFDILTSHKLYIRLIKKKKKTNLSIIMLHRRTLLRVIKQIYRILIKLSDSRDLGFSYNIAERSRNYFHPRSKASDHDVGERMAV